MEPATTQIKLLYIEMGLLDIESTINPNRINYYNKMEKYKSKYQSY